MMTNHLIRTVVLCGFCVFCGREALAQPYTVTDLGTLGGTPSGPPTEAFAINAAGEVVGWSPVPSGDPHPFLWTPEQGMQDLGTLPGASYCAATAINDAGHIVGHCQIGARGAFVWTPEDGMRRLDFTSDQFPIVEGINNRDEIIVNLPYEGAAFLVREGISEPLGFRWASGINDAGQIVGEDVYAVLWDENGRHDLGTFEGYGRSHARAISGDGIIVGECDDTSNRPHAAVWNSTGIENLGTMGPGCGLPQSSAPAINGDIIVGSATPAIGCDDHAFMYDHGRPSEMIDLNNLIPADSGWVLRAATAINASGHIAGVGRLNGEFRAFLLTPVQPTTTR